MARVAACVLLGQVMIASALFLQKQPPVLANISAPAAGAPKVAKAKDQADALAKAAAEEKAKADEEVKRVLAAQAVAEVKLKLAAEAQTKAEAVDKKTEEVTAAEAKANQALKDHTEAAKVSQAAVAQKQELQEQAKAAAQAKKAAKDRVVVEAARAIQQATEEEAKAQNAAKQAEESVKAESDRLTQEHLKAGEAAQAAADLGEQKIAVQSEAAAVFSKVEVVKAEMKPEPKAEPVKTEPVKAEPVKVEPVKTQPNAKPLKADVAKEELKAAPVKVEPTNVAPKAEPVNVEPREAESDAEVARAVIAANASAKVQNMSAAEVLAPNVSAPVIQDTQALQAALQAMRQAKVTARNAKETFLKKQAIAAEALAKKIDERKGVAERHNSRDAARHEDVAERVAEENKLVKVHFDTPLRQAEKSNATDTVMETNGQASEDTPRLPMPRPEGEFHKPEVAMKALENNGAPEQGFGGDRVQHDNMASVTTDWREEFGPKGPPSLKSVCTDPKNAKTFWCKTHALKIRQR